MADVKIVTPRLDSSNVGIQEDIGNRCLTEIYIRDGKEFLAKKDYGKALANINKALELHKRDPSILLLRSRCYLEMGKRLRALRDTETVLAKNIANTQALQSKAEILYKGGNYELALIYFHRALKLQPGDPYSQSGVKKCQDAVLRFGNKPGRGMKLSTAGDLSLFTHRKHWIEKRDDVNPSSRSDIEPPMSDRTHDQKWPSIPDDFRSRFYCPLARITKKPGTSYFRSLDCHSEHMSEFFYAPDVSQNEESLRHILGALYNDKLYLQNLPASLSESMEYRNAIADVAESGVHFLHDRGAFWDKLGPLPPPQPSRRVYQKKQGSTAAASTVNDSFTSSGSKSSKQTPNYKRKAKTERHTQLNFTFDTHDDSEDKSSVAMETDSHGPEPSNMYLYSENTMSSVEGKRVDDKKKRIFQIEKERAAIDSLYRRGKLTECYSRARELLADLDSSADDILTDKLETMATLHSYLGNAAAGRGEFAKAEYHHSRDLDTGEQEGIHHIVNRSLRNLGRLYMTARKYNKALAVLARVAPNCSSVPDVAQIFLDIGTCFMALNHHDYAKDCGKKVLSVSRESDLNDQRFHAQLLVASGEEKLKQYDAAMKSYDKALRMAKQRGDNLAEFAISKAIAGLNKRKAFTGSTNSLKTTGEQVGDSTNVTDEKIPHNLDQVQHSKTAVADVDDDTFLAPDQLTAFDGLGEATVSSILQRLQFNSSDYSISSPFESHLSEDEDDAMINASPEDPGVKNSLQQSSRKHISFKLWEDGDNLFEDCISEDEEWSASHFKPISNREKAKRVIQQRSKKIRYKTIDKEWSAPVIDTSKYVRDSVTIHPVQEYVTGNVVAAAIGESGFADFVRDFRDDFNRSSMYDENCYTDLDKYSEITNEEIEEHSNTMSDLMVSSDIPLIQVDHPVIEITGDIDIKPVLTEESSDMDASDIEILSTTNDSTTLVVPNTISEKSTDLDEIEDADTVHTDKTNHISFLYPHDDQQFSCPFDDEFTIESRDVLAITIEGSDFEQGAKDIRRYSVVLGATTDETPDGVGTAVALPAFDELCDVKEDPKHEEVKPEPKKEKQSKFQTPKVKDSPNVSPRPPEKNKVSRNLQISPRTVKASSKPKLPPITNENLASADPNLDQTSPNITTQRQLKTRALPPKRNVLPSDKSKKSDIERSSSVVTQQQTADTDLDVNSEGQDAESARKPKLYKSEFHKQFSPRKGYVERADAHNDQRELSDTINQETEMQEDQIQIEEQISARKSKIYKSKFHDQFSRKPESKPTPTKYDPREHLPPIRHKTQLIVIESDPEELTERSGSTVHDSSKTSGQSSAQIVNSNKDVKGEDEAQLKGDTANDKDSKELKSGEKVESSEPPPFATSNEDDDLSQSIDDTRIQVVKKSPRLKVNPVLKDSPYTKSVRTPRQKLILRTKAKLALLTLGRTAKKLNTESILTKTKESENVDSVHLGQTLSQEQSQTLSVQDVSSKAIETAMMSELEDKIKNLDKELLKEDRSNQGPKRGTKGSVRTPRRYPTRNDKPTISSKAVPKDPKQKEQFRSAGDDFPPTTSTVVNEEEIPQFIQKKKLMFTFSRRDGKIVFTPAIEPEPSGESKWKLVYMKVKKGDRTFTVPVVHEQKDLEKQDLSEDSVKKAEKVTQQKRKYPIRPRQKGQFRNKMATSLSTVPEDRESRITPRGRGGKAVPIPLKDNKHHYKASKLDARALSTFIEKRRLSWAISKAAATPVIDLDVPKPEPGAVTLRVPRGQEVVYKQIQREDKTVLTPVVKSPSHKVVIVRVKRNDKSFIIPLVVGGSQEQ